ncbi:MAG: class I SAM-dependent methyltransferase [Nanoarchaeota archaeon]|nr:class I SAM-dependent methyltransferase [Nanoarchaeota archaeon]
MGLREERENKFKKQYGSKKKAEKYDSWTVKDKKDYKIEVKKIRNLIAEYGKYKYKTLLDVGCGTGSHLEILKKYYECTGIDIYANMLKIAKRKVQDVKFIQADMRQFNLNKKFDIIISLFSVILYSGTYSNFKKTIKNMYNHLNVGGILILEPFYQKELELKKGKKLNKYYLYNEPVKWIKIMSDIGFKTIYLKNIFLDNPEKGLYIAIKK